MLLLTSIKYNAMMTGFRKIMALLTIGSLSFFAQAQPAGKVAEKTATATTNKPYRILTSGKQVTIKSNKDIKNIMVWTSGGHRIVEQKDINASSFNFRVTVNAKILFIMVQLVDGKSYSEKVGI
jgi:hypothetical protein